MGKIFVRFFSEASQLHLYNHDQEYVGVGSKNDYYL